MRVGTTLVLLPLLLFGPALGQVAVLSGNVTVSPDWPVYGPGEPVVITFVLLNQNPNYYKLTFETQLEVALQGTSGMTNLNKQWTIEQDGGFEGGNGPYLQSTIEGNVRQIKVTLVGLTPRIYQPGVPITFVKVTYQGKDQPTRIVDVYRTIALQSMPTPTPTPTPTPAATPTPRCEGLVVGAVSLSPDQQRYPTNTPVSISATISNTRQSEFNLTVSSGLTDLQLSADADGVACGLTAPCSVESGTLKVSKKKVPAGEGHFFEHMPDTLVLRAVGKTLGFVEAGEDKTLLRAAMESCEVTSIRRTVYVSLPSPVPSQAPSTGTPSAQPSVLSPSPAPAAPSERCYNVTTGNQTVTLCGNESGVTIKGLPSLPAIPGKTPGFEAPLAFAAIVVIGLFLRRRK